jgi:PAS domain S-box-containing protein
MQLRILILEDLPTDAELMERELKRGGIEFESVRVETEHDFVAALEAFRPELILSDFRLPTFDGLSALRIAQERAPLIPFIVVTGSMNEETAVECMKAGAFDYVLKEHVTRLFPAVIGALERGRILTEKLRAEEELRKLSRAVEQSPVSIIVTDIEGRIEYVNPKFTQLSGYRRAEVQGRNPRILKSGTTPAEEYGRLWETILAGDEWRGEFQNQKKTGELYWERAAISPIRDPAGQITHFLAIKEDITERKLAEAEHRRTQEQLVQAQKLESVGRLAGGVAHDFNNLLNVIQGYAELMLRAQSEDPRAQERIEQILKASRRAADLTRQLLAFSRRQILEPRVVDLTVLVADLEKMLRRLIGENILLKVIHQGQLGRIKADPGQIEQVLMNLAVNAQDAMPDGGSLTIELADADLARGHDAAHEDVAPGRYVVISMTDTGCGISPEVRSHMFEPFFTTKGLGKGTGLGLATVYGIVKQSGGHIWVDSREGAGTTFKVCFPSVDEPVSAPASAKKEGVPLGKGETVLLVEDDDTLRKLVCELLTGRGYSVHVAPTGIGALEAAAAYGTKVDLVVSDVIMPGMSGPEFVRILRRHYPRVKVLFISGYTDEALVAQGVLEPGVRLLLKPFTEVALLQAVRSAILS